MYLLVSFGTPFISGNVHASVVHISHILRMTPQCAVDLSLCYLSVSIGVEYVDDSLHQRVLLQLGQRHELIDGQRARIIQVQLTEALAQSPDLVGIDCAHTQTLSAYPHFSGWRRVRLATCMYTLKNLTLVFGSSVFVHCDPYYYTLSNSKALCAACFTNT